MQVSSDKKQVCIYEYLTTNITPDNFEEVMVNPDLYLTHTYSFDHVYDQESSQEEVYDSIAKKGVLSVLEVIS